MATSAILSLPSPPLKTRRPFSTPPPLRRHPCNFKLTPIKATSTTSQPTSITTKVNTFQWKFNSSQIKIHFEQLYERTTTLSSSSLEKNILLVPTISDVSTVEEWRKVAEAIVRRGGEEGRVDYKATIVDWPGLGYSDRPKLDYNADVMEKFLVDFVNSPDSPISSSANDVVIFGGGHAATIAVRATSKGLVRPTAIAAVAPTWAGPLPIVFGRESKMESRYGLLRGTLRAPALGWMMYNMLVSNEKAITSQYKSHVYADPENVTPSIIESRYALTKQTGARYVPAAFLTGLLDPVTSREEFVKLFANLEGATPVLVMATAGSPKRSKAEMEALREAKGVSKYIEVAGALLPQEEYPEIVAEELYKFLQENLASNA